MLDIASQDVAPALAVPMGQIENAFRRLTVLVKDLSQEALNYLHTVTGAPKSAALAAAYGPYHDENGHIPLVAGRSATELLDHYRRVIDLVWDYLKTRSDDEASRLVTIPWWPEPATVRYVLWHLSAHSMFHQGQISRLKAWYKEHSA